MKCIGLGGYAIRDYLYHDYLYHDYSYLIIYMLQDHLSISL